MSEKVILPDGREAEIVGPVGSVNMRLKLDDGREVIFPTNKLKFPPTVGEPEFNMVVIPAIQRLEELVRDRKRLMSVKIWIHESSTSDKDFIDLFNTLFLEAKADFNKKWGLI